MFVTDFGDLSVGQKHLKNVTNVEIQSPTSTNRHQLEVTNITVTVFIRTKSQNSGQWPIKPRIINTKTSDVLGWKELNLWLRVRCSLRVLDSPGSWFPSHSLWVQSEFLVISTNVIYLKVSTYQKSKISAVWLKSVWDAFLVSLKSSKSYSKNFNYIIFAIIRIYGGRSRLSPF